MAAKYPEQKDIQYAAIAQEIQKFWDENQIFEQSVTQREGSPTFTFYEGPPSANGTPGIHHVMARTVKDIFCRFKTLQGFQVKRKGGWDTHGLPVELQVEKMLGITKDDIGKKISIEEYNQKCRETVMLYKDQWDDLTRKMGYWVDLNNPYITYENEYIETLWYLLKQLYTKGLLYKGYTIQPYSPAAGTGLSSHELNLPGTYKEVKDTSIVAQFKVIRNERSEFLFKSIADGDVYILAWTTTPWTLPSNTALTIGEKITYVQINTFNSYTHQSISVVLAKDLVGKYFSEKNKDLKLSDYKAGDKNIPFEIVKEFSGKDLVGIAYEQLMPYVQPLTDADKAFVVIAGDFVTTEDGTGVVHTSPTFGADDFRVAKQNNIPALLVKDEEGNVGPTVDKKGKFVAAIGKALAEGVAQYKIKTHKVLTENDFYVKNYTNEDETHPDYKSTDVIISIILKEQNKAFKVEKYEHTYPHCWRTDKPVLYYPLDSWFIKTTAMKERMVELNKTINWKPESTGTGRFGNWLENLVDWNLSRSRYWGTPLPIWRTEDGKEEKCIGSIEELKNEIAKAEAAGIKQKDAAKSLKDLHRPYVDDIILVSSKGERMYRETDLIDVWFDSGAMPYAQWGLDNAQLNAGKEKPFGSGWGGAFPADFIAEGVDQTRGWFFTLHALSVMLYDSVAFKNVISNGLVLDKNGNKMSKSKGNVVNPFETLQKYGPDVVRWYMIENAPPWDNLKFDLEGIAETQRRFFGTLINTYNFFALYANIDGFVKDEMNNVAFENLAPLDRWIITKEQTLIKEVTEAYEQYEPTKAARAIQDFVNDHLSNWYVRLNRKRFWQPANRGELSQDKKAAYETLYECLLVTTQLMSPIAPFFSEWLYRNLTNNIRSAAKQNNTPLQYESIHHTLFVKADEKRRDVTLEQAMDYAQKICSLTHALRKQAKIKVRTPLQKILLPVLDADFANRVKSVEDIIKSEVNIKEIQYIDDASGILVKKVKPNFARLGKQYGPAMKEVSALIQAFDKNDIATLEKTGKVQRGNYTIVLEDVIITSEDIPGWSVASEQGVTVALDVTVTDALRKEGLARDFVNRIQNLRKDQGMAVLDKIVIEVQPKSEFDSVLSEYENYISQEVQALSIKTNPHLASPVLVDLDEFEINVQIKVSR
ncbi:MAG: isoleucine--tRNA ligase [Cyclobacteriaceae bacterium]|jgi:isoleucyl-tRNA synthetase|nr:isoleucine--tRNA ligase [Cyclobacteriaceae bacterium]